MDSGCEGSTFLVARVLFLSLHRRKCSLDPGPGEVGRRCCERKFRTRARLLSSWHPCFSKIQAAVRWGRWVVGLTAALMHLTVFSLPVHMGLAPLVMIMIRSSKLDSCYGAGTGP